MATIDLQKIKVVLEKKQLTKVTVRVGLVLDITGSMRTKNGTVWSGFWQWLINLMITGCWMYGCMITNSPD